MEFQGLLDGKDSATNSKLRVRLDADKGDVVVGGAGRGGDILVRNDANVAKIRLDAGGAEEVVLELVPAETILLSGADATITAGGHGQSGSLILKEKTDRKRVTMNADGDLWIGGHDKDGDLVLLHSTATDLNVSQAAIWLNGEKGNVRLRNFSNKGNVRNSIDLDTDDARMRFRDKDDTTMLSLTGGGGDDTPGEISIRHSNGEETIKLDGGRARITVGGGSTDDDKGGEHGSISVLNNVGDRTILIDAKTGDIVLENADCAEDFDIATEGDVEPGTVMVIGQEGSLRRSEEAYDKKVAGVLSGAGDCKPGIVLGKKHSQNGRLPVALMGKVYCKVDAQYSPVEVGDLLTTSATAGHAMKASDPLKAFGAVIGKALRPLKTGKGLIPILIALQ